MRKILLSLTAIFAFSNASLARDGEVCKREQLTAYLIVDVLDRTGPEVVYDKFADISFQKKLSRSTFSGQIHDLHKQLGMSKPDQRKLLGIALKNEDGSTGEFCIYRFRNKYGVHTLNEDIVLRNTGAGWMLSGMFYNIHNPHTKDKRN